MLFDTHAHVLSADLERYPYSTLRTPTLVFDGIQLAGT